MCQYAKLYCWITYILFVSLLFILLNLRLCLFLSIWDMFDDFSVKTIVVFVSGGRRCVKTSLVVLYDFLFIISRFKVTSSGCTEEEIKHILITSRTSSYKTNLTIQLSKHVRRFSTSSSSLNLTSFFVCQSSIKCQWSLVNNPYETHWYLFLV